MYKGKIVEHNGPSSPFLAQEIIARALANGVIFLINPFPANVVIFAPEFETRNMEPRITEDGF